jgi:large subunit ribosomal protein L5e
MPFIKVIKTKAYYKRFQVKYRRRREGKTDYLARKRLVAQDKNKYNSPRFRFVVRLTNKDIICQVVYSKLVGDQVLVAAYSHELTKYGMPTGLSNYAAAYATGLLAARRILTKFNLADKYAGKKEVSGEDYNVEELADGPHPFTALLDVGLARTTTGSTLFAALKGAVDGGVNIPHSDRRFVGYDAEAKKLDPEVLKKHILGGHVADYMKSMKEADQAKYEAHFSQYIKAGIKPDDLQSLWTKVFEAIRAKPIAEKKEYKKPTTQKYKPKARLSLAQRKDRVKQKMANKAKQAEKQE